MATDFPQPYTGSTVFHYTDAAGLLGIVQNHCLRATEATGTNDPRETDYGRQMLEKYEASEGPLERYGWLDDEDEDQAVFVACASTLSDDVSQWTRYTSWPQTGYCIEFEPGPQFSVVRNDHPSFWDSPEPVSADGLAYVEGWTPVTYGETHFNERVRRFVPWAKGNLQEVENAPAEEDDRVEYEARRASAIAENRDALASVTRLAKDETFTSEHEVRIVAVLDGRRDYVKYRPSKYGVVRYVDLAVGRGTGGYAVRCASHSADWPRLPIKSVRIAPSPFADRNVKTVNSLLRTNGYGGVNMVQVSAAQIR